MNKPNYKVLLPQTDFALHVKGKVCKPDTYTVASDGGDPYEYMQTARTYWNRGLFVLHDGPPYANGDIHMGHALNKILKDIVAKSQYFAGKLVEYRPGWDCHGLPIERKVQKDHPETRNLDPVQFRQYCRDYAMTQVDRQREQFKRLGVVADWDDPYLTMAPEYERRTFDILLQLQANDQVYRMNKPVLWSVRNRTTIAESEVVYRKETDPAATVLFPVKGADFSVAIWTTTPWTIPGNVAVALNPNGEYYLFSDGERKYVALGGTNRTGMSEPPVPFDLSRLEGAVLENPLDPHLESRVIFDDYVSADVGTGCVHIAPNHGMDDWLLGQKHGLPMDRFAFDPKTNRVGHFGCSFNEGNDLVLQTLEKIGALLSVEQYIHDKPFGEREGEPLIYVAFSNYFFRLDEDFKQATAKSLEAVKFYPESDRERLQKMISGRQEWCISRQRLWGVPILSESVEDFDEVFKQEEKPDTLDVWFDSGVSWSSLSQPKADMYLEGHDQFRGWYQSSALLSQAANGDVPFKSVFTHGFVLDEHGRKMSKSVGNVVDPIKMVEELGPDVLRTWVAMTDCSKDLKVGKASLETAKNAYNKLRNTIRYCLGNLTFHDEDVELEEIDQWIVLETNAVCHEAFDDYLNCGIHTGFKKIVDHANNVISVVYMDAVKDILYCDSVDSPRRKSVTTALKAILEDLLWSLAPVLTYTVDEALRHTPEGMFATNVFDLVRPERRQGTSSFNEAWLKVLEELKVHYEPHKESLKSRLALAVDFLGDVPDLTPRHLDFLGVSLLDFARPDNLLFQFDVDGIGTVIVSKSRSFKCPRCWKFTAMAEEQLCNRCERVMG